MSCNNRSNPPLFFLLAFVFLFFLFTSSTATPSSATSHSLSLSISDDVVGERENDGVLVSWKARRHLAEEGNTTSSMILAAKRTRRRDPLENYKLYTSGYNISNKHYWASVGFTAAPFFIVAAVWFVIFGLCLSFICLCYCCCRREPYGYSRACYALSLISLIFFTIAAIAGCGVLYAGQGKFHSITTHTLEYVVNQADVTAENLRNVSDYLAAAKNAGVLSVFLPTSVRNSIDSIQTKINSSGTTLSSTTQKNSEGIQDVLDTMSVKALKTSSGACLVLEFFITSFAFYCALQKINPDYPCCCNACSGISWICVVADTCISMDEWVQNPTAKTALDDIIPCVDNTTAQETLRQTKETTYQLVNVVDNIINNVSNRNIPPQAGALYYNQSGPLMPVLCNPYNSDYTDRQCAAGEVDLSNATQVWKNYTCQISSGICTTPGRLTPSLYNQMESAVNLSYGLNRYGPFLVNLEDCTFVRETFTQINHSYCPGLRRYTQWIYIGLVIVSAAVMLSLIFWVIYARERRHRVYTKQFMSTSLEGPGKAS
ncbi:hypothetical protein POTOM_024891 [Populus tomentosa]|uniref:Uncharacterized protein n=1 Tax=Populus tomentosa TaxID=118781 RepID=A0A8X7ZHL6_POPTO|nr:hypothetical protein POTOM_024891 [Populus tomentosa]